MALETIVTERSDDERALLLRIVVEHPIPGCAYALQRGKSEIDQIQIGAEFDLEFTRSMVLRPGSDGVMDPKGLYVQGPRNARFLYITSGTLAGQAGSCWTRRAKVSLRGIENALPSTGVGLFPPLIEARILGRARDAGPACANEPLLGAGWRLVSK